MLRNFTGKLLALLDVAIVSLRIMNVNISWLNSFWVWFNQADIKELWGLPESVTPILGSSRDTTFFND